MRASLFSAALAAFLAAPAAALRIEKIPAPRLSTSGRALGGLQTLDVEAERLLVEFSSGAPQAQRDQALAAIGASALSEIPGIPWTVIQLSSGMSVSAALDLLKGNPAIANAQPNHVYYPDRTPNDPGVAQQYALSQVNAFSAWEYETGASTTVTVAIIDAGMEAVGSGDDFSAKLVNIGAIKSQFFDPNNAGAQSVNHPPTPACNHGTRVAGIAAARGDNAKLIAGMSWGAQMISLKVFADGDCNPTGACPSNCGTTDAAIAAAVTYARNIQGDPAVGKVVINISIGGAGACPGSCPGANCFSATKAAMSAAVTAGIPVVVSAGNDGGSVNVPANCAGLVSGSGIIPVGATNSNGDVASFSSRGPELSANGLVAPGVNVITTDLGGQFASASGTSFAAPHVAGVAALMLSAQPSLTAVQVQNFLRGGAVSIGVDALGTAGVIGTRGEVSGAGRLDAFRAVRLAVNGSLAHFDGDTDAIAFPNPFKVTQVGNVTLTVPVELQGAQTKIRIYTPSGVLVKELTGVTWDGKNADGAFVASGTYLFLVTTSKGHTTGRLTLIR
jgi:hypothetical protein